MQAMQAGVPVVSALKDPATHPVHTAEVDAVATLPYLPAAHAVHTAEVLAVPTLP